MNILEAFHQRYKSRNCHLCINVCKVCQHFKDHPGKYLGDSKALKLPERWWDMFLSDFVTELPRSKIWYDAVTIFADCRSRYVHFLAYNISNIVEVVALKFSKIVLIQHGLRDAFISDWDVLVLSSFWQELLTICGISLMMSSVTHSQIDVSSKVMSRILENETRCCCS